MKDAHLAEQEYADPRPFPFADFGPKGHKQRLKRVIYGSLRIQTALAILI